MGYIETVNNFLILGILVCAFTMWPSQVIFALVCLVIFGLIGIAFEYTEKMEPIPVQDTGQGIDPRYARQFNQAKQDESQLQ